MIIYFPLLRIGKNNPSADYTINHHMIVFLMIFAFYSKFYTRNIFRESNTILPAPGELVAAKYTQNEQWYRACVVDVTEETIKVSFVDYGNSEWTEAANVKRMLPQFLHMPFQAVECFLGNIEPVENGEWSQESM